MEAKNVMMRDLSLEEMANTDGGFVVEAAVILAILLIAGTQKAY